MDKDIDVRVWCVSLCAVKVHLDGNLFVVGDYEPSLDVDYSSFDGLVFVHNEVLLERKHIAHQRWQQLLWSLRS